MLAKSHRKQNCIYAWVNSANNSPEKSDRKLEISTRGYVRRVFHIGTFLSDRLGNPQIVAPWPTKFTDFFLVNFRGCLHCRFKISKKISSNVIEISSCLKINILPTNRRRISCWFQKCITLWGYLDYFGRYSQFTAWFCWFWARDPDFVKFGSKLRISHELSKITP